METIKGRKRRDASPNCKPTKTRSATNRLRPGHLAELRESGWNDEQITDSGVFSVTTKAESRKLLNRQSVPSDYALAFPYRSFETGELTGYVRLKLDDPRIDSDGKPIKYESPCGEPNQVYLPPGTFAALSDPSVELFITEGEKKAGKADQEGFPCLGLVGVFGWKARDEEQLVPELQQVAWQGRTVHIVFDSDAATKPQVQKAEERLAHLLRGCGAIVRIVRLPDDGGSKVGLDDYLCQQGKSAFRALLVRSGMSSESEFSPFPTDTLPPVLSRFVREAAESIQCDESYVALPLLAACGAALGNARTIELKSDWREPPVFWVAIVGKSGDGKSAPLEKATLSFERMQAEAIAAAEVECDAFRQKVKGWKDENSDAPLPNDLRQAPVVPQNIIRDATVESVVSVQAANPGGRLLLVRDELAGFFGGLDRYSSKQEADVATYLEMFGARPVTHNRKTGEPPIIRVKHAFLGIVGGIQPQTLARALGRQNFANGLAARFLFTMPPSRRVEWSDAVISDATQKELDQVFSRLFTLPLVDGEAHHVRLTRAAQDAWIQFYNDCNREKIDLPDDLQAAWAKLLSYAARFALVIHSIREATEHVVAIDEQSIAAGIRLARWCMNEAARIYGVIGGETEKPDARERREVLAFVREKGKVTPRDVQIHFGRYKVTGGAKVVKRLLRQYVEEGLLKHEQKKTRGRPSDLYWVAS